MGAIQRRQGGELRRPNGRVMVVAFSWVVHGRLAEDGRTSLFFCKVFISYSLYK